MGREGGPSLEEMGLKSEETRVLSDAELIKGGARKAEGGRLEVTAAQQEQAKKEMRAETMRETYLKAASMIDSNLAVAKDFFPGGMQEAEGLTDNELAGLEHDTMSLTKLMYK